MAHFYRVEGQKEQAIGITKHTMEWNLQFQSHKTSSETQIKHLFRIFLSYIFRRTMEKNEHAPEAPTLCINNCGFFGTPATMNMCSKCHKNIILNQNQAKLAASIISGGSTSTNSTTIPLHPQPPSEPPPPSPERCTACRKRVGLTGFSCRCGNVFCSVHRYSDKHECSIDYRAIGKDAIAKANPIVKAEKLDKI